GRRGRRSFCPATTASGRPQRGWCGPRPCRRTGSRGGCSRVPGGARGPLRTGRVRRRVGRLTFGALAVLVVLGGGAVRVGVTRGLRALLGAGQLGVALPGLGEPVLDHAGGRRARGGAERQGARATRP